MIDTHTHLYHKDFENDIDKVVKRAIENGVEKFYLPAIDSETHQRMFNLEAKYPEIMFPMMGLHPTSVKKETWKEELQIVENYLNQREFCAIGEIGIDLYWEKENFDIQQQAFEKQIDWAIERNKPIVIHSRESFDETFEVLQAKKNPLLRGIFHCFSGNLEQAEKIIDLGFYLGIGGVVTFKNGKIDQFLQQISIENIVLETDAPYLAPVPHRGKRNESAYLPLILGKLVDIYQLSFSEMDVITTRNAKNIFEIQKIV